MNSMPKQLKMQRSQGQLFEYGLPDLDMETGYRGYIASKAVGITYRQLDY